MAANISISLKEAAEISGIPLRTLQGLCLENKIPGAQRIGNMYVVPREWAENLRRYMSVADAAREAKVSVPAISKALREGRIKGEGKKVERESFYAYRRARWSKLLSEEYQKKMLGKHLDEYPESIAEGIESGYLFWAENYSLADIEELIGSYESFSPNEREEVRGAVTEFSNGAVIDVRGYNTQALSSLAAVIEHIRYFYS